MASLRHVYVGRQYDPYSATVVVVVVVGVVVVTTTTTILNEGRGAHPNRHRREKTEAITYI